MAEQEISVVGQRVIFRIAGNIVQIVFLTVVGIGLAVLFFWIEMPILIPVICLPLAVVGWPNLIYKTVNNRNPIAIGMRNDGTIIIFNILGKGKYIRENDTVLKVKAMPRKEVIRKTRYSLFYKIRIKTKTEYNYGQVVFKLKAQGKTRYEIIANNVLNPQEAVQKLYSYFSSEEPD